MTPVYRFTFETTFDNGAVLCTEFPATSEDMAWNMYNQLADELGWTGTAQAAIAYQLRWL